MTMTWVHALALSLNCPRVDYARDKTVVVDYKHQKGKEMKKIVVSLVGPAGRNLSALEQMLKSAILAIGPEKVAAIHLPLRAGFCEAAIKVALELGIPVWGYKSINDRETELDSFFSTPGWKITRLPARSEWELAKSVLAKGNVAFLCQKNAGRTSDYLKGRKVVNLFPVYRERYTGQEQPRLLPDMPEDYKLVLKKLRHLRKYGA